MTDLHLDLDPRLPLSAGVERALRGAIETGQLGVDSRLPASRELAADLAVARNTVARAYEQLVAEGILAGRRGAGTFVLRVPGERRTVPAADVEPALVLYDLRPGSPDVAAFPAKDWARSVAAVTRSTPTSALGYGNEQGELRLRETLAAYLSRTRNVRTDASTVVIFNGFREARSVFLHAIKATGGAAVATEELTLPGTITAAHTIGLAVEPLPLDEHGAQTDRLAGNRVRAVFLTPAHQYPMGMVLSAHRRSAAISWAQRCDGWVVEDDYDGEFRYDRRPVGAMQSLAPDRVVYAGTVSKALAPALRLGWMSVPREILPAVLAAKRAVTGGVDSLRQLALAHFITEGHYDRHVRRMRREYRHRRDLLVQLTSELAPAARLVGLDAGLHVVVDAPTPAQVDDWWSDLQAHRIAVHRLSEYGHLRRPDALVVGFGTPSSAVAPVALRALVATLRP